MFLVAIHSGEMLKYSNSPVLTFNSNKYSILKIASVISIYMGFSPNLLQMYMS